MAWSKEQVVNIVSPLIRKYDWNVEDIKDGVKLTVTDGEGTASVNITGTEDIRSEAMRLLHEVDNHNYKEME